MHQWTSPRLPHRAVASILLLCATISSACAADVAWRTRGFQYAADGKPISEVLRDFAASQGLLVSVAPEVEGTVKGRFSMSPDRFLDLMANTYGFSWYYNGAVLQVTAARGMKSALVAMPASRVEQLERTLQRMRMKDRRFPIRYDREANAAVVVGPEEYVQLVMDLASQLERQRRIDGVAETRVFKLRYARAGDRAAVTAEGGRKLGVASTMQEMYRRQPAPMLSLPSGPALGVASRSTHAARPGREGQASLPAPAGATDPVVPAHVRADGKTIPDWWNQARFRRQSAAPLSVVADDPLAENLPQSAAVAELPVIVADEERNAVIVRDLPQRMAQHEQFIRELDQRPEMVEIEVHVIDVDETALDALGVDWQLRTEHLRGQTNNAGVISAQAGPSSALTVVLSNAGNYFLSRINALEQQERARVIARPRLATLNNVEALMDRKQTFQVRVAGTQAAELYSVSAGITMRVTPAISDGLSGDAEIRLGVHIEDGQLLDRLVDNLPVVASSKLETQAIVKPGESLLIAGYISESSATGRSGVPGLSRLPVFGSLFSSTRTEGRKYERLFLLSPRLLQ